MYKGSLTITISENCIRGNIKKILPKVQKLYERRIAAFLTAVADGRESNIKVKIHSTTAEDVFNFNLNINSCCSMHQAKLMIFLGHLFCEETFMDEVIPYIVANATPIIKLPPNDTMH